MIKTEIEEEILCVELLGYVGDEQKWHDFADRPSKLEYRGYDSAGIAVRNEAADKIAIVKAKGRLKTLIEKTDGGSAVPGTGGIITFAKDSWRAF